MKQINENLEHDYKPKAYFKETYICSTGNDPLRMIRERLLFCSGRITSRVLCAEALPEKPDE